MKLFCSYAHEDVHHRRRLEAHLAALEREGLISSWSDEEIVPGDVWRPEIDAALRDADVIVLLVSADFINSDFIWDVELREAMARHAAGTAVVVPVIVRPADWQHTVLGSLEVLPANGLAVTDWPNEDAAWLDVVHGLRRAIARRGLQPEGPVGPAPGAAPVLTTSMLVAQGEGLCWVGRGQDGVAALDAAIAQPAPDHESYLARARALMLRGRPGEALAAFDAVLTQTPDDPGALIGRAQTEAALGRLPAAFADADRVVRNDKHNAYARYVRGTLHEAQGDVRKALEDYDASLRESPFPTPALVARGFLYGRQNKHDRAVEDFTRTLSMNPNVVSAIVGRGWSYLALDRVAEAAAEFQRALALEPNNGYALNGQAEAQRRATGGGGHLKKLLREVFS